MQLCDICSLHNALKGMSHIRALQLVMHQYKINEFYVWSHKVLNILVHTYHKWSVTPISFSVLNFCDISPETQAMAHIICEPSQSGPLNKEIKQPYPKLWNCSFKFIWLANCFCVNKLISQFLWCLSHQSLAFIIQ